MKKRKSSVVYNADGVEFNIYPAHKNTPAGPVRYWMLVDYSTGKRRVLNHTSEKAARQRADEIRAALPKGQAERLALSNGEWQSVCFATEVVRSVNEGYSVYTAAKEWAVAVALLNGNASLEEAVRFYLAHHKDGGPPPTRKPFEQTASSYYDSKIKSGMSKGHCKNIKGRLKQLVKVLPDGVCLDELTAGQLDAAVLGLGIQGKTRNEYRAILSNFYAWAAKQNPPMVAKGVNPAKEMERHKVKHREAGFCPVGDLRKILAGASLKRPDMLPLLVLVAFSGLRPSEAIRLDWSEVGADYIRLPGKKSKTGYSRQIPIQSNLKSWLSLWRKPSGPVSAPIDLAHVNQRIAEFSGITLSHDSLRHSFGTYRQQFVTNVGMVSDEMGNSAQICRRHYLNAFCTEKEAKEWFNLMPPTVSNIVNMPSAIEALAVDEDAKAI
jgi:integrase